MVLFICFRIRQEKNGGAWCPKEVISKSVREFLEVKLHSEHLVTHLETQGRFGNGQGQEYAEAYLVEYWRDTLGRWVLYRDARSKRASFCLFFRIMNEFKLDYVMLFII